MNEYANWIASQPARTLRELAMGRQIADCLGNPDLAEWCKQRAEHDYNTANLDDMEMARYHLARMDVPQLVDRLNMPGHMGWHIAARLAEYAYHNDDRALLEKSIYRLYDFSGVDSQMVDPQLECVIADVSYYYLMAKHTERSGMTPELRERLRTSLMRAKPIFRQRAMMDIGRLFLGIHYGEAA